MMGRSPVRPEFPTLCEYVSAEMTATPRLPIRAYLYDLGRNQRPNMDQWRFIIDALSEFGFNMMLVNLEWRFHFPAAPGLAGPGDLTPEMARQLVEYGQSKGVEVVAQPNLVGHCEGMGAIERYAHLSANPYEHLATGGYEQINLELPEARELVAAMLQDVLDAFPGQHIHIGLDEVRQLAHIHPDDPEAQQRSRREMILWLVEQARATGRTVMMWGDMLQKQPELMDAIERDVILCEWYYGPDRHLEKTQTLRDAGFRVLNCPATHTYSSFGPRGELPFTNITHMLNDAATLGIDGFVLTHWEMGIGSAFDFTWPWLALCQDIVAQHAADDAHEHLVGFAEKCYGGGGEAYAALHHLLSDGFHAALDMADSGKVGHSLRYAFFRGAPKGVRPAYRENVPKPGGSPIWEPSPAMAWWQLRPRLDQSVRDARRSCASRSTRPPKRWNGRSPGSRKKSSRCSAWRGA